MSPADFEFLASFLKLRSGLTLGPEKGYLLESRLVPVARRWGAEGLDGLIARLRRGVPDSMAVEVVEAMTTNESFFFRDNKPFEQFREFVLPELLRSRAATRSIRIWSAACSNGQEPYSLAMLLREREAALAGWRVELLATDISREVLRRAEEGLYSQFEVQRGLPIRQLMQYFDQEGERWRVKPVLRSMVAFRYFNLLDDPGVLGRFDVVFLRNVLIYFDQPTKTRVLEAVARQMAPDGVLFLGGAETVLGVTQRFRVVPEQRGLYMLNTPGPASVAAAG